MDKEALEHALDGADLSFHEYDGMQMTAQFPAKNLDRIKETVFDDDDILVATYPKCGKS